MKTMRPCQTPMMESVTVFARSIIIDVCYDP